jgi:hypothetical protein
LSAKITSTEAREKIVEAIELDLIGPTNDHAFTKELLPEAPTRWYLTGFLVPVDPKFSSATATTRPSTRSTS